MHLISIGKLRAQVARYSDISRQIQDWYNVVKNAKWQSLEDVREIFSDAEAVGNLTVFNIKGNAYRLIVGINYKKGSIYYKYFLTHAEYSKDRWKNDPYF